MVEKTEVKEEVKQEEVVTPTKTVAPFSVVEVPTQFGLGIRNTATNEVYDVYAALSKLLSDVEDVKKHVHG